MIERPHYIPQDYAGIEMAETEDSVYNMEIGNAASALLYPRRLNGDFNELASALAARCRRGFEESGLLNFTPFVEGVATLSRDGKVAKNRLLDDMSKAVDHGFFLHLRVITPRSYIDKANWLTHFPHEDRESRLMCAYNAPVTQGIRHDKAVDFKLLLKSEQAQILSQTQRWLKQKGLPVPKQKILETFSKGFYFLRGFENFSFAPGDVWFQRGRENSASSNEVLPHFIHYAPEMPAGTPPRLLLTCGQR